MLGTVSRVLKPTSLALNGAQWRAVQSRDKAADGAFVYAVRSTGVYCRPSCPSRKPRREQVLFFRLPEQAEQKGFRACQRCRPQAARSSDSRIDAVAQVCREIQRHIWSDSAEDSTAESRLTLAALSAPVRMSPHQLGRAFRAAMGITPRQYADAQRMRRLKSEIKKGDNVTTALYEAGYGSSSRLYERAPGHLGMTPAAYGRGGEGMQIHFTIVPSPLGRLLVGATQRGISAVYLGESDDALRTALRKEYPRAALIPDAHRRDSRDHALGNWLDKILAHLRGHEPHLNLPTDVQATAFQRRVWEELRRIPYGATSTYSEVARAIGRPAAVRAVARACATNPTSLVVPCHRVIRKDGDLTGYRWGIDRKRSLLKGEAVVARSKKPKAPAVNHP